MTSWKTSLGGALAGLGTFLWGAPVALKAMEIEIDPALCKWCIIIGLIASAGGVFFMGLFGRDNNVTSEDVAANQAAKAANKESGGFRLFVWTMVAMLALGFLIGCATRWIDKVSQTRSATVKAAYRSAAEYNAWLQPRTNDPAAFHTTYGALMTTWTNVDTAARSMGRSALLLEDLEDTYRATPTNQSAVVAVVNQLAAQSSNLTSIVKGIVHP